MLSVDNSSYHKFFIKHNNSNLVKPGQKVVLFLLIVTPILKNKSKKLK